jgi:cell wall-associated NlpC family hydrolase
MAAHNRGLRARFYSTKLGRFMSADPLVGGSSALVANLALSSVQGLNMPAKVGSFAASRAPANPQSLDRYSYVLNNPLHYTDPSGLSEIDTCANSGYCPWKTRKEKVFWTFLHALVDQGYSSAEINRLLSGDTTKSKGDLAAEYARSQIGKPYVSGAEGPNAFDCSGLAKWSYQQVGVDVGKWSQTQYGNVVPENPEDRLTREDLLPGDLVFYADTYDDPNGAYWTHVAVYVGGGMIVVADEPNGPGTGSVREVPLEGYYGDKPVAYGRPKY